MAVTPARYAEIHTLADQLVASCDGGAALSDDVDALTLEECRVLDSLAFCCEGCDQWYEIADQTEDTWKCKDCA